MMAVMAPRTPSATAVETIDAELRALLRARDTGEVDDATFYGLMDRGLDRRFRAARDEEAARIFQENLGE